MSGVCTDLSFLFYPLFAFGTLAGFGIILFGLAAILKAEKAK